MHFCVVFYALFTFYENAARMQDGFFPVDFNINETFEEHFCIYAISQLPYRIICHQAFISLLGLVSKFLRSSQLFRLWTWSFDFFLNLWLFLWMQLLRYVVFFLRFHLGKNFNLTWYKLTLKFNFFFISAQNCLFFF